MGNETGAPGAAVLPPPTKNHAPETKKPEAGKLVPTAAAMSFFTKENLAKTGNVIVKGAGYLALGAIGIRLGRGWLNGYGFLGSFRHCWKIGVPFEDMTQT